VIGNIFKLKEEKTLIFFIAFSFFKFALHFDTYIDFCNIIQRRFSDKIRLRSQTKSVVGKAIRRKKKRLEKRKRKNL